MTHRKTSKRDERGAILVLSTVGLVLALIAGGLAVDVGFIAQEARQNQKVADLAAMDAARALPADPTIAARESALRNGFSAVNPPTFVVETGTVTSGVFTVTSLASANAVRVSVTSTHDNQFPFLGDNKVVTRRGIATNEAMGGFMIGSSLTTIDTGRSALLDRFMGGMLRGTNLSFTGVGWSGLVGSNITLEALRFQLASMGVAAGTVEQLMNANITMQQLLQASAQALALQGPTTAAQVSSLNILRAGATATTLTSFKLGRFMTVDQGAADAALASTLNVFQLVTGSAQVANGNHFVEVSDVGIAVPNVTSTKIKLQVIEPPKWYFGPVGGSVSTAQIDLTVTPKLDLDLNLLLARVRVTSDYPLKVTGAGATGTLTAADCSTSPGITVRADPSAFSGTASTSLIATVSTLVGDIATVTIPTTSAVVNTDGGATDLRFNYPAEFPPDGVPPDGVITSKHAGSQPIGLSGLTNITTGSPVVGLLPVGPLRITVPLPLPVGDVVNAVTNALGPVIANVDSLILTRLLGVLGMDIGSADVTALALRCGTPTLVG